MKIVESDGGKEILIDEIGDDYESGIAVCGAAIKVALNRAVEQKVIDVETSKWLFSEVIKVVSEAREDAGSMAFGE